MLRSISAKKNIAAVESLQLDPDEIRKQWSAIRDRTILGIRNVRHNVVMHLVIKRNRSRFDHLLDTRYLMEWKMLLQR